MTALAVATLLTLGAALVLLAAVGLLRLPDLYTRMHATTKPATLGVSLMVSALAVHAGELGIATRAALIVIFFLLTAPVAAQRLGHAAHRAGVPCWRGTVRDELADARGAARATAPPRSSSRTMNPS
jgi:multicomponent Na+:H+ antiporter subunit G